MAKNKKWKLFMSIVVSVIAVIAVFRLMGDATEAESATPGSIDDPVVTKSYVDKLVGGGSGAKQELEALMEKFRKEIENSGGSAVKSEVVIVKPGEVLLAAPGAQFVLRAGKGVAYSSDSNGISDVTAGQDIKNGQPVANNHLLMFPREGRGVAPDPTKNADLTVLVVGDYEILPPIAEQ